MPSRLLRPSIAPLCDNGHVGIDQSPMPVLQNIENLLAQSQAAKKRTPKQDACASIRQTEDHHGICGKATDGGRFAAFR
jgi:hypothetical protein